MSAVERIAGLKPYHVCMAQLRQLRADLGGRATQIRKIGVLGKTDSFDGTADIKLTPRAHLGGDRMSTRSAIEGAYLGVVIPFVDLLYQHYREEVILWTTQRKPSPFANAIQLVNWKRDRNGKQRSIRQPHSLEDRTIIALAHEPIEWRKSAGGEKFQIADRSC